MAFTQNALGFTRRMPAYPLMALIAVACGAGPQDPMAVESSRNKAASPEIRGDLIQPLTVSVQTAGADPMDAEESVSSALLAAVSALFRGTVEDEGGAETKDLTVSVTNDMAAASSMARDTNEIFQLRFDTLASYSYTVRLSQAGSDGKAGLVTKDKIPAIIRALNGRRVSVTGYVMPLRTQGRGVTQFLLARDQLSCCFGASPQMNHWIYVTMPRGDFRPRVFSMVTVTGTLHVGELKRDGLLRSIYQMDAEKVELNAVLPPPAMPPASPQQSIVNP